MFLKLHLLVDEAVDSTTRITHSHAIEIRELRAAIASEV